MMVNHQLFIVKLGFVKRWIYNSSRLAVLRQSQFWRNTTVVEMDRITSDLYCQVSAQTTIGSHDKIITVSSIQVGCRDRSRRATSQMHEELLVSSKQAWSVQTRWKPDEQWSVLVVRYFISLYITLYHFIADVHWFSTMGYKLMAHMKLNMSAAVTSSHDGGFLDFTSSVCWQRSLPQQFTVTSCCWWWKQMGTPWIWSIGI